MLLTTKANMIWDLLRTAFFGIDQIVYFLVSWMYDILMSLADIRLSYDAIQKFAGRIYVFAGIFMLFRITFSLITYLADPDKMNDKQTGGGKIVVNVLVSIILLVMTPTIFETAFKLQSVILNSHVLEQVILGVDAGDTSTDETGNLMKFVVFSAFFTPDVTLNLCENGYSYDTDSFNPECEKLLGSTAQAYADAHKTKDIAHLSSILNYEKDGGTYLYEYRYVISTIAGGFVAYLLFMFCFDVVLRIVKLAFLQLIAPIPILSYIDPGQSKDGMFTKWYKMCFSTFLSLFIRLAAIFFAIFVINLAIDKGNWVTGEDQEISTWMFLLVILGALMFAKELPKIIEDITGIKLDGGGKFSLSLGKKLASIPVAGKVANTLGGGIGELVRGNGFRGFKNNWNNIGWGGDEGKSVFDTRYRKLKRDINEKRDPLQARLEGRKNLDDKREEWKLGEKSVNKQPGLFDTYNDSRGIKHAVYNDTQLKAMYRKAGFRDNGYIEASIDVEKKKMDLDNANIEARTAASELNLVEQQHANGSATLAQVDAARRRNDAAQENIEKKSKALDAAKDILDNVGKDAPHDAQLDKARKVYGKAGSPNPRPPKR